MQVINQTNNRVRANGRMQGKLKHGGNIRPTNQAFAYSSCTGCQTYAVALQIVVYRQSASVVAPVNEALAINYHCTGCNTVARALQYVIPTANPDELPPSVQRLSRQVSREIRSIQSTPGITPAEGDARVNAVIGQFQNLAQNLNDKHSETRDEDSPNASPIDRASPAFSGTPSAGASPGSGTSGAGSGTGTTALEPPGDRQVPRVARLRHLRAGRPR